MLAAAFLSYASSTSNVVVSVDVSNVTNPSVNRKFMGCHSDYGFAQTPQGFSGNLVYGAAFGPGTEGTKPWSSRITGNQSSHPSVGIARGTSFAGQWSMSLYGGDGRAEVALVTRGIGGSGFSLEAGKPYTFAAWVWKSSTTTMFAELRDFTTNTSLARVTFDVVGDGPPWGATWQRYNVTLTPSAATTCVGIPFGSDPTIDCGGAVQDAVCVRCGGELLVGLAGGGSTPLTADSVSVETKAGGVTSSSGGGNVAVGHVSLMPGAWGLLHDKAGNPLPVLKSAADVLTEMGITTFRSGGSVSQSMRWKDWRGPEWNRPSSRAVWGRSETAGWGPFEVIDMCMALDIEPIITLAYDSNDETDWGDLVEYAFGDATTSWGARRHADGHAAVYNVSTFELGNEQYNPNFVEQVAAMEARAAVLNAAKGGTVPPMRYMFPFNGGLNAEDAQRAIDAKLPIERIMPDVHVGATGAVEAAATLFANPPVPGFAQSAINCETNAGSHDLKRALDEATDLIDWFTADTAVTNRLYARTASFCSGSAAHFDAWPQGISFFLPNMTWLQPPGYVHVGITETWAEQTVAATAPAGLPFAAQLKIDDPANRRLVLRAVNAANVSTTVDVELSGAKAKGGKLDVWVLSGSDLKQGNTAAEPKRISPKTSTGAAALAPGAASVSLHLPAFSFVIASLDLA